jgi:hypothetical protein
MPSYEQNKRHIYKWRENNIEKLREHNRKNWHKRYEWIKISKIFRNILI